MATGDDGRIPKDHEKMPAPMQASVYTKTFLNGLRFETSNDDKNAYVDVYFPGMNKITFRPNGDMLVCTTGDLNAYNMSGDTSTCDHNKDHKGHGVEKQQSSTKNEEVPGKHGMAAGGDIAFVVMGKANIRAQSAYIGTDKDLNINCGGNCSMKVKGDMKTEVGGTYTEIAKKITMNPSG